MKFCRRYVCILSLILLSHVSAQAGTAMRPTNSFGSEFPFEKGTSEFQALLGGFYSFNHAPDVGYALGTLRLGWMLGTPSGESALRGNTELFVEVFGGGIFDGPGSYLTGVTLLLRYNFVQPEARLVPYFQLGAGGLYSDASRDDSQRLIGSEFSFNLQASAGLRYMFSNRCALVLEGGYRHISNAKLADRNTGVDAIGGMLGISVFY